MVKCKCVDHLILDVDLLCLITAEADTDGLVCAEFGRIKKKREIKMWMKGQLVMESAAKEEEE